jgi:hypothetical protein
MSLRLSRRAALTLAPTALGTFLLDPTRALRAQPREAALDDHFPSQELEVVREVVGVSHFSLERVRGLVDARPELAKAAWDWGFGDWETALGAASHTGNHDIARYLIDHGARPDLFTAAMMGHLAAVRALVEATPGIQRRRGPHGITLLAHARAGGEPAREVVRYLEDLGDADPVYATVDLTDEQTVMVQGTFGFGPGGNDRLTIEPSSMGGLALRRGEGVPRQLFHLGDLEFHPSGAPSARIRVEVATGTPRLEIHNPDLVLSAIRLTSR